MTDRPKVGGRRQPPGGRPPKGNVKFYCYLQPGIVDEIDRARGELSRGEYITLLVDRFRNVAVNVAKPDKDTDLPH